MADTPGPGAAGPAAAAASRHNLDAPVGCCTPSDHAQALAIARDISVPFEVARALEGIGNSHLHDGHPRRAAAYLRQALAIYQRIGGPAARRVRETLDHHEPASISVQPHPAATSSERHQPRTHPTPSKSQEALLALTARSGNDLGP